MNPLRSSICCVFVCASVFVFGGCGASYVSTKAPDAHLIAGHAAPDVRAAIIRALAGQRHVTESEEAGKIVARLGKPSSYARVTIEYSETQYVIRYVGGSLETKPGPDGDVLVEKRYAAVTKRLKDTVDSELQRPARERAEAERNRREYDLLLQQQRTAQAQAEAQAAQGAAAPAPSGPTVGGVVDAVAPHVMQSVQVAPPTVQYNSSVRRSDQNLTCCINGSLYKCPSQDAFQECFKSGPGKCSSAGRC